MIILVLILIAVVVLFQLLFLVGAILPVGRGSSKSNGTRKLGKVAVIIPVYNSEKTIGNCLVHLLKNNVSLIDRVVIVFDHCEDGSRSIVESIKNDFKRQKVNLELVDSEPEKCGKAEAILRGFRDITSKNALLIDSDIILADNAIETLLTYHVLNGNFYTSCYIYPFVNKKASLISGIINNDRLYRQNILQRVKMIFGLANFPGGIGVMNIDRYKEHLNSGFLEDLTASLNIIRSGSKISVIPTALAYEVERQSLKGVVFQRVRWTIGNIQNTSLLIKTIGSLNGVIRKMMMLSYPVMWYWQHYAIVLGSILFVFVLLLGWGSSLIFLLPLVLYAIQIFLSSWMAVGIRKIDFSSLIAHCIIYPYVITFALLASVVTLAKTRSFYFKTKLLFIRI